MSKQHSTLNDDAVRVAREVADRSLTDEPVTGPRYTTLSETAILADAVIRLYEQYEDLAIRADERSKMIEEYRETIERMHADKRGLIEQLEALREASASAENDLRIHGTGAAVIGARHKLFEALRATSSPASEPEAS